MRKLTLFVFTLLISCSTTKLSETEKENLKIELKKIVEIDQIAANIPQGKYKEMPRENWDKFKDSVFKNNKIKVEKIYTKYGFLGIDKVGKDGSFNFWLLVQHFDEYPDFQQKILKDMKKEVAKKNANPQNYAYLSDRVNVNTGKKQQFGTQVDYRNNGQAKPKNGLIDSLNVDKIRNEYELVPLKDYLNRMTQIHFEMNKEYLIPKGVLKPNLYQ